MTDDYVKKGSGIHIGVIPDGNRRYAIDKGRPIWEGHVEGAKKLEQFIKWCTKYPEIKRISVFALSKDNLVRSDRELKELWKVYEQQFKKILKTGFVKNNDMQVRILGDDSVWAPEIRDTIKQIVVSTKQYSKQILNIMLAYGSKFEMTRAIKKMVDKPMKAVDRFLLVKEPLDLVIRTGDQYRLSNFMMYQASYAEIYFSKTMWPAFTKKEFEEIMKWYHYQTRKFGR
jgi:undecaprenyl diphosphate synthase